MTTIHKSFLTLLHIVIVMQLAFLLSPKPEVCRATSDISAGGNSMDCRGMSPHYPESHLIRSSPMDGAEAGDNWFYLLCVVSQ